VSFQTQILLIYNRTVLRIAHISATKHVKVFHLHNCELIDVKVK